MFAAAWHLVPNGSTDAEILQEFGLRLKICLARPDGRASGTKPPCNQISTVPEKYSWPSLSKKDGDELFDHYRHTLEALGLLARRARASNQKGLLGLIT